MKEYIWVSWNTNMYSNDNIYVRLRIDNMFMCLIRNENSIENEELKIRDPKPFSYTIWG